jgi:manganese/zinc/iron transport system permease protein
MMAAAPWLSEQAVMHGWAMATAAVVSAGCALVGTLLVVRRMSLLGDAISHAVLPGIVVAVLAGGRMGGPIVLVGATATALATVWLTRSLSGRHGVAEDAAAGIVFTTFFAAGVVLVTALASRVDLDASCVLHGILELVPFDTVRIAGLEVPRAFVTGALVLAALSVAAVLTWKEQLFAAFDTDAAQAAGMPVGLATTCLLAATSLATVASFEAVGAILVVAMLVVPAATAELLVHRLHWMAFVAILIAVAASCLGYVAAWHFNTSAAGMIAVVLGLGYLVAALVAPGDGVISRLAVRGWLAWRVTCEDCLAALWRGEEAGASAAMPPVVFPTSLRQHAALLWLRASGRISMQADGGWRLSPRGRSEAETVVRSHRLWEAWLGRHAELPLDHLHPPAEWIEHHLGAAVRERLEAEVGLEASDPHGRAIPPERT